MKTVFREKTGIGKWRFQAQQKVKRKGGREEGGDKPEELSIGRWRPVILRVKRGGGAEERDRSILGRFTENQCAVKWHEADVIGVRGSHNRHRVLARNDNKGRKVSSSQLLKEIIRGKRERRKKSDERI